MESTQDAILDLACDQGLNFPLDLVAPVPDWWHPRGGWR